MLVSSGSVVPDAVEPTTSKLDVHDVTDSPRNRLAIWALLVLAGIIATAGVVADSTQSGGCEDLTAG